MDKQSAGPTRGSRSRRVSDQYRHDERLRSRYLVHQQFSVAKRDYLDWIFDYLLGCQPTTIFDLGCGPGYLWHHNARKVPAYWSLTLGDRSQGMLEVAKERLKARDTTCAYVRLEARDLPLKRDTYDAVLCLHVLHHLSEIPTVLREIRQVLKQGGRLIAATNGDRHMSQFKESLRSCGVETAYFEDKSSFSLQTGKNQLRELFESVECIHFKDALHVTRVEPLLDYARSGIPSQELDRQRDALKDLERHWKSELEREGVIRIEKQAGLFIAGNDR